MRLQIKKWIMASIVIVFGLFVTGSAIAGLTDPLQNGDFSNGLDYWDGIPPTVPGIEGDVFELPNYFGRDWAWFEDTTPRSFLRQAFLLPTDASSIDIKFAAIGINFLNVPAFDRFQGFLRDPVTLNPIINVAGEDFFFSWDFPGMTQVGPYISDSVVSVDVSGYGGQGVLLEFGLIADNPLADTYVLVDNVSVTGGYSQPIVPAPFSVLLCATGITLVASFRRRFI